MIYDNVLGKKTFELVQKEIVYNKTFPWYIASTTFDSKPTYEIFDFSWAHIIFKDGEIVSPVYSLLYPVLLSMFDKINQPINNIIRLRLALQTPIGKQYINDPHIDFNTPHQTALLYLNSSDGNTIIYNEIYSGTAINKFTIKEEVSPIENRLVIFNGLNYHSSQRPINCSHRIILNINYV